MKTVILYGELAKRFGKYHSFAVKNVAEAVRALRANFKDFEHYMATAHLNNVGFKVFVGGQRLAGVSEIHNPQGKNDVIRIVPVLVGAGSGWVKVIIGATLIAAGVVVGVLSEGGLSAISTPMISAGAGLVIGGVAQLLTAPPDINLPNANGDTKTSYLFNGPQNTAAQGAAVPVGYGRMIVGSVVISAGITEQVPAPPVGYSIK